MVQQVQGLTMFLPLPPGTKPSPGEQKRFFPLSFSLLGCSHALPLFLHFQWGFGYCYQPIFPCAVYFHSVSDSVLSI